MFRSVVGHSNDPDSRTAVQEILDQCFAALAGDIPQAGILFAALDFDHELILQSINQAFPGIQLIGGTTDGEISSTLEFQQDSLVLMVFCSDQVEFCASIGRNVSHDPIAVAQQVGNQVRAKATAQPQLCITTPESLTTSGVSILEGLKQSFGQHFPIVGGSAGDQWKFKQTYQFFCDEVLSDSVPVLLLSGNLLFGHGLSSGWTPIGRKGIATSVEGNVLYEVDGQPTLEFYRNYLGDIRPSPEYRLAVFEPNSTDWYMRSSNGSYEKESGSISFFADIPKQAEIQVVGASRDNIINAAQISMQAARENYPGTEPAAALFFSCTGRMRTLGTRAQEEYQVVKASTEEALTCCGFYTYGEIAPLRPKGEAQFHNETFVTLLLGTQ